MTQKNTPIASVFSLKNSLISTCGVLLLTFFCAISTTGCKEKVVDLTVKDELADVEDLVNEIGPLSTKTIEPLARAKLSEQTGSAAYRYDEQDDRSDYYFPIITENRHTALENVINMPPMQSIDIIWPGNLVQGESLLNGSLAPIPLGSKRKGGTIYLSVVSGQDSTSYSKDLNTLSGASVTQAMNDILAPYTSGLPARTSYIQQSVHSSQGMAYYLDMSTDQFDKMTKSTFSGINWSDDRTRIMVKLEQIYFTMSYDYGGISELFHPDIKVSDLSPYTGQHNPMCYISSVSYGRYFILLYDSGVSSSVLSKTINKVFDSKSDVLSKDDERLFSKANIRMIQIGGDAQSGLETISGDADKLQKFIIDGAKFSKQNVGAPISYDVRYLYNSKLIPTYKELDVTFKTTEYFLEKKVNDVKIEIHDIFSKSLTLSGGDRTISSKSCFWVEPIEVEIYQGNTLIKSLPPLNPDIVAIGAYGNDTKKIYSHIFQTGPLGENTTKKIVLKFKVTYYTERWGGGTSKESKSYAKRVEFTFDDRTELWKAVYTDDQLNNRNFKNLSIRDNFNWCNVSFDLNYSFTANRKKY